jgi:hypothetical protein
MTVNRRRSFAAALALAVGLAVSALPAAADSDDPVPQEPTVGDRLEDLGPLLREKLEALRDELGRAARQLEERLRRRGDRDRDNQPEDHGPVEI